MTIDREAYLAYALAFTQGEYEIQKMLMEWLPDTVIDCHAHGNLAAHVEWVDPRAYCHMLSTFPHISLEESAQIHRVFFPGKTIRTLRFPHVFRGINHEQANAYLLSDSPLSDQAALYGLPDDVDYTVAMLSHRKVAALKMYPLYPDPAATRIYEYFPPEVLGAAQARELPIILHPPRVIMRCRDDLRRLLEDFPRLRVVLAYLGLTKVPLPGLSETYKEFARFKNLSLDTAMVPSGEVVRLALKAFGTERVMFGSDEPLFLIRAAVYEHPQLGQRLISQYPYHWLDPREHAQYQHLADGAVHALWPSLIALKDAIDTLPSRTRARALQQIFFENAGGIYGFS